jgi:hypothetical protein
VEIAPCSGDVRGVHVSALEKRRRRWQTISGWDGFWSREDGAEPDPEPLSPIALPMRVATDGPSSAQLCCLARKLKAQKIHEEDADARVPLSSFLRAAGKEKEVSQAKRFLTSKKGRRWLRPDGVRPRVNTEYKFKKGVHGGGTGDGILHGRLAWLRFVYWKYLPGIGFPPHQKKNKSSVATICRSCHSKDYIR